jgi:hypothetical protein
VRESSVPVPQRMPRGKASDDGLQQEGKHCPKYKHKDEIQIMKSVIKWQRDDEDGDQRRS